jgi:hypothetical protein
MQPIPLDRRECAKRPGCKDYPEEVRSRSRFGRVTGVISISVIEVGLPIVFSAEGRFASETKMTTLEDKSYIVDYDLASPGELRRSPMYRVIR